ncbi:MAG: GntR family transcriptional regulator [Brevibacillus sp.]|nr:GntR family transcriptional regulator [Brevibacillus sp.]
MKNLELSKKTNYSIRDHIYQELKKNIISLKLEPGLSISEKEISAMLNVSRTPVREAFVKLAQEELLEIYPQKGTFVSLIDLDHVEEARFIREHLERATVRVACEKISADSLLELETNLVMQQLCVNDKNYTKLFELDEEFHSTLAKGCGKERVWSVIQQTNLHLNRIRMLRLASNYNWDTILSQHREILNAIKERDPDKAEQVMKEHLTMVIAEQDELKKSYPNYFK